MTAELYRGRSKTSSFQFEGEMVSGFNAGNRIGTGKRPCVYEYRVNSQSETGPRAKRTALHFAFCSPTAIEADTALS
jgi:hypothetical protein